MRFPDSFLDDIRERLPIADVVGSRVTWDRKKTNAARGDFWACCPFHGESTPSFHCENRKGRYYCFGCGASGDHFKFLVELDGLNFPEAVERLADQAGLPLPVLDQRELHREQQRASLFDVMDLAAGFFRDQLNSPNGAAARSYLRGRGLTPQTQTVFTIGYAPDSRNALKNYLAEKGITKDAIEACGLVVHGPEIAVSYDRFRDRIMFPIPNARGRFIAFGGRAIRSDIPAKYLNSPETELFHKSRVLFNYANARQAARQEQSLIVVEGYMDVIALHAAGFQNAVAPLGTALTEFQLNLLWRLTPGPILCFDGDAPGIKAAGRAAEMAMTGLQPGRSIKVALLPADQDPDDVLRNQGPEAMKEILDGAQPLVDFVWTRETTSGIFDTPEKRAELEARLFQLAGQIGDESVRRHYTQDFRDRLNNLFGTFPSRSTRNRNDNQRGARPQGHAFGRKGKAAGRNQASNSLLNSTLIKRVSGRIPLREAALVAGILHHPAILQLLFDEFAGLPLNNAEARTLQRALLDVLADVSDGHEPASAEFLADKVSQSPCGPILERMNELLRHNGVWQALPNAGFEDALDGWRQAYTLHMRVYSLRTELKAAEGAMALDDSEANFERLVQIHNELAREDGTEALIDGFGAASGRPSKRF